MAKADQSDREPGTEEDARRSPGSVVRSFQLVEHLSREERGLTLTELARELDSPKSTTLKLLRTLEAERLVVYHRESKTYFLGPGATALAWLIINSPGLKAMCRPYLEHLAKVSTEDVYLGIREEDHIVYIDKVEGSQSIRLDIALGTRRHMHSSAVGKLFLAQMEEDSLEAWIRKNGLPAITASTLTESDALRRELNRIRQEGVSISQGENIEGIRAIAAPIHDVSGEVVAAVSVSGPRSRLDGVLDSLIDMVKNTANSISEDLLWSEKEEPDDGAQ